MSNPDHSRSPSRLGRGLSALLGTYEEPAAPRPETGNTPRALPVASLSPSPLQPRRHFDEAALAELASSIKEKGILQPILVRPSPSAAGIYEIVAGERRWRAAQSAGIHEIPVVIRELTDGEVLEAALIENVQRADLNGIEEAQGYRALIDEFGYTQDQLAKMIGKSRPHLTNSLRLLALPEDVQALVVSGALTSGHARALVGRPDAGALARRIVDGKLSVRQAEALARHPSSPQRPAKPPAEKDADTLGLEKSLADHLGLKAEIQDRGGAGELRLHYKTLEQLEEVCRRLMRS